MTQGKIEGMLMTAPEREFNNKKVAGYFLSELVAAGVPKGKLKKLVKKGIVKRAFSKMTNGELQNFYSLV